jgi:hypothetical protein
VNMILMQLKSAIPAASKRHVCVNDQEQRKFASIGPSSAFRPRRKVVPYRPFSVIRLAPVWTPEIIFSIMRKDALKSAIREQPFFSERLLPLDDSAVRICPTDQRRGVDFKRSVEQILRVISAECPPTAICRNQCRAYQTPRAIKRQRDFDAISFPLTIPLRGLPSAGSLAQSNIRCGCQCSIA